MNTYCKSCGTTGTTKTQQKGSFLIELFLWVAFFWTLIIPLVYSVWRLSGRKQMCRCCKSTEVIPVDSPLAKKLMAVSVQR